MRKMPLFWMRGWLNLVVVAGLSLVAQATPDGVTLYAKGRYEEAVDVFRRELAAAEHDFGADSVESLKCRNNLANALNANGRSAEAEVEHRKVLMVRERVLGREHAETLSSRSNLAVALHAQGKYMAAEIEYREVLTIRVRVRGVEDRDVLKTSFALALCVESQGRLGDALTLARQAENGWTKQLGASHPVTLRARMARLRMENAGMVRQE
ncbi:tetratricopeptide repeat protein [Phragmitibacter flavus]|uniref:Tetratricopeptide repeat protein n=2 Tax=Phragmitibacter flavus TaxID=2576071 RepID=A0A5R8KJ07_9BACT|nr:tetratricopeptide repeat protein [Phragmitibacter flavus]